MVSCPECGSPVNSDEHTCKNCGFCITKFNKREAALEEESHKIYTQGKKLMLIFVAVHLVNNGISLIINGLQGEFLSSLLATVVSLVLLFTVYYGSKIAKWVLAFMLGMGVLLNTMSLFLLKNIPLDNILYISMNTIILSFLLYLLLFSKSVKAFLYTQKNG